MMGEWLRARGCTRLGDAQERYAGEGLGAMVNYTAAEPGKLEIVIDSETPTDADLHEYAHEIMGTMGHVRPAEFQTTTVNTEDGEHSATFTCAATPGCRDAGPMVGDGE